jgi:Flp pilus assembly protein TadD
MRERLHRRLCVAFVLTLPFSVSAVGTEEEGATVDPDFAAGKRAIDDQRWDAAIPLLKSAALRDTRNADIQNYLGFAHRKLGRMDEAFEHYERALKLNPRHRGAHEYAGEASLLVGDLAAAQKHLDALKAICLVPCEELEDLEREVMAYKARAAR